MVRFGVRSGDAAWAARRPGRPAGARLQAGARLTRRGARSFASSSTNFQDLAHLADVGASMSSGADAALQEVLEELSVPARRAPPPPGPAAPAPAARACRGPAQGPPLAERAEVATRHRRLSDTPASSSAVGAEVQHERLTVCVEPLAAAAAGAAAAGGS
jgi:hypothetical protein